jgi:hypothetical protein
VQLSQLDWANHTIGTEDAKWWTEAVAVATIGSTCACGQTMPSGAAVCNKCLDESTLVTPSVCKGCGKVDHKVVSDFCRDCEVNGTEWTLCGGNDTSTTDTSTDMNLDNDWDEDKCQYEVEECPCGDEGCRHCNPL